MVLSRSCKHHKTSTNFAMASKAAPDVEAGGTGRMMELLYEMETAAEDILTDRQQIIELDRKRQKTREAYR